MKKDYGELEKRIGYEFKDIRLLITALTHTSFANELKVNKTESYERLEFLGDAILEYIVSDYLFHKKREYERKKSPQPTMKWKIVVFSVCRIGFFCVSLSPLVECIYV